MENLCHGREPQNSHGRYAVAVQKDDRIIGHLPRKVSRVCLLFLRQGGVIRYTVSGRCKYAADLLPNIRCTQISVCFNFVV